MQQHQQRPPRDQERDAVRVWDPEKRVWLPARDRHLRWFALRTARVEFDVRNGYDSRGGVSDPTTRTLLDAARVMLVNLHNVLGVGRAKLEAHLGIGDGGDGNERGGRR